MKDRLVELLKESPMLDVLYASDDEWECVADSLIEEGVIISPCKVGDTVYEIQPLRKRIQPYEVITVKYNGDFWYMLWKLKDDEGIYGNLEGFVDSELGRTVFLTKGEAEKALAEKENDNG